MTRNKKRLGIYKVRGSMPGNRIPFYVKEENKGVYARESFNSWITSPEYDQLEREGWALSILDGFEWTDFFTMLEYVDHLEFLRVNAPGGPKGPKGTMMKSIGCNSYGKTVEKLDGIEYVWAKECPVGYCSFIEPDDLFYEDPEALSINQFIWLKQGKEILREYHQPQLGSFITAYVRMMVRRAALMVPDAFLYADTDCCAFSQAVDLPLCEVKYGFWKLEVAGEPYGFIDKKVYYSLDGEVKHSKGIDRKKLTVTDFEKWFDGSAPVQNQIQKNNLLKVLGGEPMFRNQERKGSLYSGP